MRACAAWAVAALAVLGGFAFSESVTMTTYYPAPSGVYTQMVATQNAYLSRDGGSTVIGRSTVGASKLAVSGNAAIGAGFAAAAAPADGLVVEGQVGIGTTSPQAALDVSTGAVRFANLRAAPAPAGDGSVYYDTGQHAFLGKYDASAPGPGWRPLGGASSCRVVSAGPLGDGGTVSCPAGTNVTGGGCASPFPVLKTIPSGNGWKCANGTGGVTAYAICCP